MDVKGSSAHPLYARCLPARLVAAAPRVTPAPCPCPCLSFALLQRATLKLPDWNFAKYLVDRSGRSVAFYEAAVQPVQLQHAIQQLLQQPA